MKKIFSLLIVILFLLPTLSCSSSSNEEHLTFMGMPIDGKPSDFVSELKDKGFIVANSTPELTTLCGEFLHKTAAVFVATRSGKVGVIGVRFQYNPSWDEVLTHYANCKSLYSDKYGNPQVCQENYNPQEKATNFMGILTGQYKVSSIYKTKLGYIKVCIETVDGIQGYVSIRYEDYKNVYKEQVENDLENI